MVTNRVETLMGRRQTNRMIEDDKISIVLERRTKISTPGGGWRWSDAPPKKLKPQECALIPFKRRMTEFLTSTEAGDVADLPYILLGRHDMDIKVEDQFWHNAEHFVVKTLDISAPEQKTLAHVDYYGGGDTNG